MSLIQVREELGDQQRARPASSTALPNGLKLTGDSGWKGSQRRTSEEGHLDLVPEGMEAEGSRVVGLLPSGRLLTPRRGQALAPALRYPDVAECLKAHVRRRVRHACLREEAPSTANAPSTGGIGGQSDPVYCFRSKYARTASVTVSNVSTAGNAGSRCNFKA